MARHTVPRNHRWYVYTYIYIYIWFLYFLFISLYIIDLFNLYTNSSDDLSCLVTPPLSPPDSEDASSLCSPSSVTSPAVGTTPPPCNIANLAAVTPPPPICVPMGTTSPSSSVKNLSVGTVPLPAHLIQTSSQPVTSPHTNGVVTNSNGELVQVLKSGESVPVANLLPSLGNFTMGLPVS